MKKEYGINGSMRKSVTPTKTEYFLFNSLGNMKAYSDNGEIYGYYGYDAKGERTYKAQLKAIIDNTSIYPNAKVLNIDRLFLYPDGFTTITQDGNYTKHYYADDQRIASKIGSGYGEQQGDRYKFHYISSGTISDVVHEYDCMKNELGELTHDTIDNIVYPFNMPYFLIGDSGRYENAVYYYHGNNISSTQLITDITGSISQAILFCPFGQIISEYRSDWMLDTIPRYLFCGHERDAESGLDYMKARHYSSDDGTFRSRDLLFEKFFYWSPYTYCYNNPVRYIDPDGKYGSDGHYWTVYAMGLLMGSKQAAGFATHAENFDNVVRNANSIQNTSFFDRYTWLPNEFGTQQIMHGLTGGSQSDVYAAALNGINAGTLNFLHLLGDAFAHATQSSGYTEMYGPLWGHGFSSDDPDNIGIHSGQYNQYIDALEGVMSNLTGFTGSVDRTIFNIVSSNTNQDVRTDILKGFCASKEKQSYTTSKHSYSNMSNITKAYDKLGIKYKVNSELKKSNPLSGTYRVVYSVSIIND